MKLVQSTAHIVDGFEVEVDEEINSLYQRGGARYFRRGVICASRVETYG